MAEQGPSKSDIEDVFKRLRALPANKVCNWHLNRRIDHPAMRRKNNLV